MALRSFRANVALRTLLLAALLSLLAWSLLRQSWDATPLVAGLLLAAALFELIRYVERGTRDLAQLLRAVAADDFTMALPRQPGGAPFAEYETASRTLMDAYRRLDLQRAASDELLRTMIEQVGAAVFCFSADGRVPFANAAARELFGAAASQGIAALAATDPSLPARLLALRDDDRLQVDRAAAGGQTTLLLHARCFTLLDVPFTAVVCHDIREELESRDVAAWQALTRVLTHEMMNSLTPIMTLSGLLRERLASRHGGAAPVADDDVVESIETIHERSSGLAGFIQAYRQFSNPPLPEPAVNATAAILEQVARLMRPELEHRGIRMEVIAGTEDAFFADAHQIEQVLINLVRNAQDALQSRNAGLIELRAARDDRGRALIHVTDNGPGIAPDMLERIFVPFFTTRSGGTGIGLALSRQLMRLNGGAISVQGTPGQCRFTLRLPPIHN
jgi:nitrogen fixation/metabolism regulation signal transduction histidine kinase